MNTLEMFEKSSEDAAPTGSPRGRHAVSECAGPGYAEGVRGVAVRNSLLASACRHGNLHVKLSDKDAEASGEPRSANGFQCTLTDRCAITAARSWVSLFKRSFALLTWAPGRNPRAGGLCKCVAPLENVWLDDPQVSMHSMQSGS